MIISADDSPLKRHSPLTVRGLRGSTRTRAPEPRPRTCTGSVLCFIQSIGSRTGSVLLPQVLGLLTLIHEWIWADPAVITQYWSCSATAEKTASVSMATRWCQLTCVSECPCLGGEGSEKRGQTHLREHRQQPLRTSGCYYSSKGETWLSLLF